METGNRDTNVKKRRDVKSKDRESLSLGGPLRGSQVSKRRITKHALAVRWQPIRR